MTRLPPDHPDAPKYWPLETSGVLEPVVRAYLQGDELDPDQVKLMQAYLWQWVKSPVWEPGGPAGILAGLRLCVMAITKHQDVEGAIESMIEWGMDPL